MVGNVGIGGSNPVRIQSMTNTNTMNTMATMEQAIRLFEAGCELVRITASGVKEAEHLEVIKRGLSLRGYNFPLIADIHYSPKAAEVAATIVDKVRINPGNYTERNQGKINFSAQEYADSLANIREKLTPLINICKQHGTAIRLGSNHGSLSDRIIDRFGDTPEGMAEAAMEFARICQELDFHNIIFSMKSSNTRVMVYATRLLVKKMMDENMNYPIHLGVTEAGAGLEGRLKSAVGTGTLLSEGIGDTIRVSLTEDPEREIPVARKIVDYIYQEKAMFSENIFDQYFYPPFDYNQRKSIWQGHEANLKSPIVLGLEDNYKNFPPDLIWQPEKMAHWKTISKAGEIAETGDDPVVVESTSSPAVWLYRDVFKKLKEQGLHNPVILKKTYTSNAVDMLIEMAIDFGPLFLDGFGDGIFINSTKYSSNELMVLSYYLLQASGARITSTEYIACPSCGRTQYNIQKSLEDIREATNHLTGLKIAVMGCIVNGPGEMADADYGYVGMGEGKVALYKGKKQVKKNIPESKAIESLIELIKESGDWVDP
jgi:(E)-4-hydroxy-3-methylbut-2-enyl-diphosphate synthase